LVRATFGFGGNPLKAGKNLFFLSSPHQYLGERVRVRGHLTEFFLYHPSLPLFPFRDLAKGPPSAVILISILKSGSGISRLRDPAFLILCCGVGP